MNFSKMLVSAAVVLVVSLALIEAGGPYRHYLPTAPAPQYRAPTGPYHSYAVRPAIYGGPRLYSYRGYARHPLPAPAPVHAAPQYQAPRLALVAPVHAPVAHPLTVHLKAAAYSPYSHAPLVAPLQLAIETPLAPVHHAAARPGNHYGPSHYGPAPVPAAPAAVLRPVKAVLLAPVVAAHPAPLKLAAAAAAGPAYGANKHQQLPAQLHQHQHQHNHLHSHHHHESAIYEAANHASLAGPLFNGEAPRPASYGAGHYYQALETLKAQGAGYGAGKAAASHHGNDGDFHAADNYNKASSGPATGGY